MKLRPCYAGYEDVDVNQISVNSNGDSSRLALEVVTIVMLGLFWCIQAQHLKCVLRRSNY